MIIIIISYQLFWCMIQPMYRNQRAVSPEGQLLYHTPKQLITTSSHDCHLDLCIGYKNEQTHLEYLEYLSI